MRTIIRRFGAALLLGWTCGLPLRPTPCAAWTAATPGAGVGLLDGGSAGGRHLAGVEIRLPRGAITYWRSPGDAGVAPTFDFSGSRNLKAASVAYPAPTRLEDGGALAYGYAQDVVFPVEITPADPAVPVRLDLVLDYALCTTLCLPAKAHASLVLDGSVLNGVAAVAAAVARVPTPAVLGGQAPLRIATVRRGAGDSLVVEAVTPDGSGTLFVEAPSPLYFVASPGQPDGDGRLRFVLAAPDGLPSRSSEPLRLTLVSASGAIEVAVPLDDVLTKP